MRRLAFVIAVALALPAGSAHGARADEPVPFVTNVNFPTNMVFASDGRLSFTERTTGDVRVVSASGQLERQPFLHVDVDASSTEFGLCTSPQGTMYETENGPDVDDEVNRLEPAANYGWPTVTGFDDQGRFTQPLAVLHDTVALTGCAVWHGTLYVGSFVDGDVRAVTPSGEGPWSMRVVAQLPAGVKDLEVGPDGHLFVATAIGIYELGRDASVDGDQTSTSTSSPSTTPGWRAWIAIGAALLLIVGLVMRLRAGRRLRRESRERNDTG